MDESGSNESKRHEFERELLNENFEDLVVNLLRAVASEDPRTACSRTGELMKKIFDAAKKHSEEPDFVELVFSAISAARRNLEFESRDDHLTVRAAKRGLSYLAEASCSDSAAAGRAAKRRNDFRDWAKAMLSPR